MSKAEHMGVSPSQVSGQTGNDSCPKQRTSEQASEFGAECAHSEPPQLQHLLGSEALQNKPQEISTAVTSSYTNERFSGDLSKSSQTNKDSCSQQTLSEQKNEFAAECISSEQLEPKHQLEFEIILNEPKETSTVMCSSVDNENLQPVSEDVSKSSKETSTVMCSSVDNENLQPDSEDVSKSSKEISFVMCSSVDNENLQPVSEDVSKSSQTDTKQTLEFVSGRGCDGLNAECICSELLEQKHQLSSKTIRNEPADADAIVTGGGVDETLQPPSEDVIKVCHTELLQSLPKGVSKSSQIGENSCPQQPTSAQALELTAGIASHGPLEVIDKASSELVQNEPGETSTTISCSITIGQLGLPPELLNKSSPIEHLKQPDDCIKIPSAENLEPPSDDMVKNSSNSEAPLKYVLKNSKQLGHKGKKASKSLKKKYMLRSFRRSDRVLRSRSDDKPKAPESSNNLADVSSTGGKRIKKQNRSGKKLVVDEYSRIRTHLRYLLNRINYERSLISAYSGEGWKGLSIEKLKPEKELQRATSEILRRKLKIRDLFQRLDSLCAEGRFPESLFDSEGQIDSEDIFCAKCGSKDLSADNDIILCDGACDRGFHQNCLEPPLLKEDIPPDDEGWLCPGCDCKVDCIDLVNDSQGTNLFITDNWEKVFPEAAAAGHNQDPNFGLPSDDSDDNDYDPDGSATDEKDQGDESSSDESSSDESDFTSASDELEPVANNNEDLGLPSEDSGDDDYNPDAPVLDEKVTQESSSSDFTSDSEDLAAVLEDNSSSGNDEVATSVSPLRDSNGQRSKCDGNNESLNNELLSILESGQDGLVPAYEKRSIERLDYKKLYDETYRNAPSDSSDDEDWTDNDGPSKRMKRTREGSPVSPNGNAPVPRNRKQTMDIKQNLKETEHNPNRRTRRKLNSEDTLLSSAKSLEGSSTPGSIGGREKSSYRRLGEDVTQRLYKSFKENQYPDRTAKENLAKDLGITFSQVSKWFENARWSFNHSSSMDAKLGISASEKSTSMSQSNKKPVRRAATDNGAENVESPKTGVHEIEHSRGDVVNIELATQESNGKKSTTRTSSNRKRNGQLGHQASDLPGDSPEAQETQTSGQTRTRRRKTVV